MITTAARIIDTMISAFFSRPVPESRTAVAATKPNRAICAASIIWSRFTRRLAFLALICRGFALTFGHELQIINEAGLHFFARDDRVDQAMVEEEFGGLEARGEFGLGGILDNARAGEADHGAGFGDDQVAHAGVTCHHSGGCRMSQHAAV